MSGHSKWSTIKRKGIIRREKARFKFDLLNLPHWAQVTKAFWNWSGYSSASDGLTVIFSPGGNFAPFDRIDLNMLSYFGNANFVINVSVAGGVEPPNPPEEDPTWYTWEIKDFYCQDNLDGIYYEGGHI